MTELDWLGGLITTWKEEAQIQEKSIRSEIEAEHEGQSRRLEEKEALLRDQEREAARREEEAQEAMVSAGKIAEDARAARDDLDAQERALREAEEALKSREQQIEAAMRAWNDDGQGGRSRYVSAGEAMQYVLTFIGRMETKIGDSPVIEGGRSAWRVRGEQRGLPGHAGEAGRKALPENRLSLSVSWRRSFLEGGRNTPSMHALRRGWRGMPARAMTVILSALMM